MSMVAKTSSKAPKSSGSLPLHVTSRLIPARFDRGKAARRSQSFRSLEINRTSTTVTTTRNVVDTSKHRGQEG
jgi:hypothetical protein